MGSIRSIKCTCDRIIASHNCVQSTTNAKCVVITGAPALFLAYWEDDDCGQACVMHVDASLETHAVMEARISKLGSSVSVLYKGANYDNPAEALKAIAQDF